MAAKARLLHPLTELLPRRIVRLTPTYVRTRSRLTRSARTGGKSPQAALGWPVRLFEITTQEELLTSGRMSGSLVVAAIRPGRTIFGRRQSVEAAQSLSSVCSMNTLLNVLPPLRSDVT